jgi:hypothetical protein
VGRKTLLISGLIVLSLLIISWGSLGHKGITGYSFLSLNSEMLQFNDWKSYLMDHASDADNRRNSDPDEGPKHYIDIDNYPEFVSNGAIVQDPFQLVALHGSAFVIDNGTLPWATIASYDSLSACFERRDWNKAKVHAADLGHYVADGYMPLHITKNYDGKLSGNDGIHSQYETSIINTYAAEIIYSCDTQEIIGNISDYIFKYIYRNYSYVDSVLEADDYARSVSADTYSAAYKSALWLKTKVYTITLFKDASDSYLKLFYSAWVKAGRPLIAGGNYYTDVPPVIAKPGLKLEQIFPNPFTSSTDICFVLEQPSEVLLEIKDFTGKTIATLENRQSQPGEYNYRWTPVLLSPGVYFVCLKTKDQHEVRRIVFASE